MTDFTVFDMLGDELKVDDQVAGAFSWGSSAQLRVGIISEFKAVDQSRSYNPTAPPNYYLKVRWVAGYGKPDKPSLISVSPNEKCGLLKVDIDAINRYL